MPALGPFARHAATYRRHGYSPIPVRPGSKAPCLREWSRYCTELPSPELVQAWVRQYPRAGIAVALGPAFGIVALDLDHDVDGLHARVLEDAGSSPVAKRAAKGPTYFYRYAGERSRSFARNGQTVAEILSTGRLVILPPTIHPDTGKPYQWVTPQRLLNRDPASLPPLNAAGVAALFEPAQQPPRRREALAHIPASAAILADALRHIAPEGYQTWIQVGMVLKAELDDAGFQLWDDWSAASPKYDGRVMDAKWRSFDGQGITAGTIFHLARQEGWSRPAPLARAQRHQR
jgi:hypothetical protein